ncbi:uncharacterized protein LOC128252801 isoform X2 [Drosophila gunungcola]|uniref:uncharacterized protein LOC128252801 isoform X2 n=1 Tax=Drosophila gunungcola TaxID=103775 RepID=UPI0022E78838|nr:uncharacterized protein LOC128252801 isoform X2 [Drosophila gunungcola]
MRVQAGLVLFLLGAILSDRFVSGKDHTDKSWIFQLKKLRSDLRNCYQSEVNQSLWSCFRSKSLHIFEDVMSAPEISLYDGVRLVSAPNVTDNSSRPQDERKDLKHLTWFDQLAVSLAKGLTTHTLQVNLGKLTERYLNKTSDTDPVGSARLRRHRYNMIITMMFGVTALGAILVPMGFQMLSIVSGKALLLAKMALLLASINGLKRVANNGLHYGLYHVPGEHLGGYYDRGDVNHPRNVPIPVAVAPTLDMGLK